MARAELVGQRRRHRRLVSVRRRVQEYLLTRRARFVMSDAWMDEFVYQAVVDPAFVDKAVRDVLDKPPRYLPLWDPMGALA